MGKIEDLQKIKKLLDAGLISQKEFENLKLDIIGKPDSINSNKIQTNTTTIKDNEKQCPSCKSIINKYVYKCPYCNYDLKLENNTTGTNKSSESNSNVEFKPKEKEEQHQSYQDDENSNIKLFIIFGVMLLFIGSIWFYSHNKNKSNDTPEMEAVDTTAVVVDTTALAVDTAAVSVDTTAISVEENENFQTVEGYSFENYKIQESGTSEKALINYSSNSLAKTYKTLITDEYKSGEIDFAGFYITAMIHLTGTNGIFGVIVDTRDGKVYQLPDFEGIEFDFFCENATKEFERKYNGKSLIYYPNSNLLVARGYTNKSLTYQFYTFDENNKKYVKIDEFENPFSVICEE